MINRRNTLSIRTIMTSNFYLVCSMMITYFVTKIVNKHIVATFGDPSGIGFGWGMIFFGWIEYIPVLLLVFLILIIYFQNVATKIKRIVFILLEKCLYSYLPLAILSSITSLFITPLFFSAIFDAIFLWMSFILVITDQLYILLILKNNISPIHALIL